MNLLSRFLDFREKYRNYQVDDSIRYTLYYLISFVICGILVLIERLYLKNFY